jgi:hypothetical protein
LWPQFYYCVLYGIGLIDGYVKAFILENRAWFLLW